MKNAFRKLVVLILALTILFTMPVYSFAKTPNSENVIWVDLDESDEGAKNYDALMEKFLEASKKASDSKIVTVKIREKGTYKVHKRATAKSDSPLTSLGIRSNTTFDLNGSTLIKSGKMGNMIQVYDSEGNRTAKAYNNAKNITIQNGTLDGSGNLASGANLINAGHSKNLTFKNLTLKNCKGGHIIELTGCCDCLVDNCVFTGFHGTPGHSEALQFDICAKVSEKPWNGVYAEVGVNADNTPCKNITVTNCTFKDYPSAIGNHKTVYGANNSGIIIKNNKFINSKDYDGKSFPAIWAYWFDDSEISGNVFIGNYSSAVQVSGGSVKVENNIIGSKDSPVDYKAIKFTSAYGYIQGGIDEESDYEGSTGGTINNNEIYVSAGYDGGAITIFSSCVVDEINNNKIICSKSKESAIGINISGGGTKVTSINGNEIAVGDGIGVKVANNSFVGTLSKNDISSTGNCLSISSSAKMSRCKNNTMVATKDDGIYITGGSSINRVEGNKVTSKTGYGIYYTSSGDYSKTTSVMNDLSGSAKSPLFGNNINGVRYFGDSRYLTSFATAEALKVANGKGQYFDNIIIANGMNYPDALAGSYLAAKIGAPIIMACTQNGGDDTAGVSDYLAKSYNKVGTIYILGGDSAVSSKFETKLINEYGKDKVVRLAGEGRYETNLEILSAANMEKGEELLICDAYGFADALSVSALGKPILLIDKNNPNFTAEQEDFVKKASKVYLIGGTAAVPSKYETLVKDLGIEVERVSGNDRYETSIAIANKFSSDAKNVVLATGLNFPDGLCGGTVAYSLGAPLVLTRNSTYNGTSNTVYKLAQSFVGDKYIVVLGGDGALDRSTISKIKDIYVQAKQFGV